MDNLIRSGFRLGFIKRAGISDWWKELSSETKGSIIGGAGGSLLGGSASYLLSDDEKKLQNMVIGGLAGGVGGVGLGYLLGPQNPRINIEDNASDSRDSEEDKKEEIKRISFERRKEEIKRISFERRKEENRRKAGEIRRARRSRDLLNKSPFGFSFFNPFK